MIELYAREVVRLVGKISGASTGIIRNLRAGRQANTAGAKLKWILLVRQLLYPISTSWHDITIDDSMQ
jgi:hypothetical protein